MTYLEIEASKLGLQNKQLELEANKLNETIRNNNLNHRVNIEKNEITRLYNEQLNDRELQKLAHEIEIAWEKLSEDQYYHDLNAWIDEQKMALQEAIANASNATTLQTNVRSSISSLAGAILRGIGQKFIGGVSTDGLIPGQYSVFDYLTYQPYSLTPGDVYDLVFSDNPQVQRLDLWPDQTGGLPLPGYSTDDHIGQRNAAINGANAAAEARIKKLESEEDNLKSRTRVNFNVDRSQRPKRKERAERMPQPSTNVAGGNTFNEYEQTNTDGYRTDTSDWRSKVSNNYDDNTSGGTDYTLSGGLHSEAVIVAPR